MNLDAREDRTFPTRHAAPCDGAAVLAACQRRGNFGFVAPHQIEGLAADPSTRLVQLLVRMGGCRFIAAAQDVPRIVGALEAAGDYMRDAALYGQHAAVMGARA